MTDLEKRAAQMKWDPPPPGSDERKEMPADAFLSPSTRTYPYKVKIDGQWVISVKGLRSAISVANFQGKPNISSRASAILEKLMEDEAEHSSKVSAFLEHYGIRGMRWGVRRQIGPDGRVTASREHVQSRQLSGRPVSTLSNEQLSSYNKRLNLEQQYSKLNPSTFTKGHNKVKAILAVGTTMAAAYKLYNSDMGKAIRRKLAKGASAAT